MVALLPDDTNSDEIQPNKRKIKTRNSEKSLDFRDWWYSKCSKYGNIGFKTIGIILIEINY